MLFCFQKLSQKNALIIADNWKYDGEYAFYDMTADPEDYEEFVDEKLRNENDHFEAIMEGDLVGFFMTIIKKRLCDKLLSFIHHRYHNPV